MRFHHRRSEDIEEGESYYVSMTDMMVGVLFIFIIMLSYFALEFRETTVSVRKSQQLPQTVTAAQGNGAGEVALTSFDMQYPISDLFVPGTSDLTAKGEHLAESIGGIVMSRLDCQPKTDRDPNCAGVKRVRRVVVSMSTRYDPASEDGKRDAALLPARSTVFHDAMIVATPALKTAVNQIGNPILVSTESSHTEEGRNDLSQLAVRFYAYTGGGPKPAPQPAAKPKP